MSPEREREFADLRGYIDFYATEVLGIDPADPIHPANAGTQIAAQFGRSKALDGLRQSVIDTVEESANRPLEYVQRLDALLRERGLLTLSEIRRRYSSAYKRVLKQRALRTETEYYLVTGILTDDSAHIDSDERSLLGQMVARYEGRDA
jgi:hypothetical protein